jgi:hypothetical protein
MKLFSKAENEMAYLKCGIQGFAGSGKTFTAVSVAIGLHKYIKSDKPVLFIDTETGIDFLLSKFKAEKIELLTAKSRAFVDLLAAVDEAERQGAILVIDSITHFWVELMDAYQKKKNKTRLLLNDWMPIKQEWRQFTEKFINSKCHIILCGRAGWEFDYEKGEDGVNELVKTGTKMKAEGEMSFESSLLIEMVKVRKENNKGKQGGTYFRRAWVLKDRFDKIDSQFFDNPTFENFLPHISLLNIGGEHRGIDADRNSQGMFNTDNSAAEWHKKKDIALEELKDKLSLLFPSSSKEDKEARIKKLESLFGSSSQTFIENLSLEKIVEGLNKIKEEVAKCEKEPK